MSVPQTVYEWINTWDETKSAPCRMLTLLREAFEAGRAAGREQESDDAALEMKEALERASCSSFADDP